MGVLAEVFVYRMSKLNFSFFSKFPNWFRHRFHIFVQSILFGWLINSNLIFLFQHEPAGQIHHRLYFENVYFTTYAHFILYTGVIAISGTFKPETEKVHTE